MRIHILQHVGFEGPGSIEDWARQKGAELRVSRLDQEATLPLVDEFDVLIVLGGPMGVHDEGEYPWLAREKACIRAAIEEGKVVLGICLGAQLIAQVLGAEVTANPLREIGWFPISGIHPAMRDILPDPALVMHWHGDTFQIPVAAEPLASSEACRNQGFISHHGRVVGLQFHLETTPASLAALLAHAGDDLRHGGPFVQSAEAMLAAPDRFPALNRMMAALLHRLLGERG